MSVTGKIHSYETCGTVDGPGIRFVIFCQGCPLHCLYCHNPDTWDIKSGKEISAAELVEEAKKYKPFFNASNGGGITVSGGDPLLQPDFVYDIFKQAHRAGIHTALDTAGCVSLDRAKKVLTETDLVLLDLKTFDSALFKEITGGSLDFSLKFLEYLAEINKPVWIRFVLVPGLTDNHEMIAKMAQYLADFQNLERIEVLPFHKMGEYKWKEVHKEYKLTDTPQPTEQEILEVKKIFQLHNLHVI